MNFPAKLITTKLTWDDLILPMEVQEEIENIIKVFNNIHYVYRGKKLGRGSAIIEGMKIIIKKKEIDKIIENRK